MFVVFDLDGTLALNEHRTHYIRKQPKDWNAFFAACGDDGPCRVVIAALHAHLAIQHTVEIWSGRSDQVRLETEQWVAQNVGHPAHLLKRMRSAGDHQPDVELKRTWLNEARAAGHAPDLVYDDRDVVVAMWREEGIPCFQTAPGPF